VNPSGHHVEVWLQGGEAVMGRPVEGDYVSRSCPRDGARAAAQARQPPPAQDHGRATRPRRRGRSGGSARLPGRWLDATVSPRRLLVFHSPPPQPGRQLGTARRGGPAGGAVARRRMVARREALRRGGSARLPGGQVDAAAPRPPRGGDERVRECSGPRLNGQREDCAGTS